MSLEISPGAASESGLITTDSFGNLEQMNSSIDEIKHAKCTLNTDEALNNTNSNYNNENTEEESENESTNVKECDSSSKEWATREKHIFVLSFAGKPIYTRYGNEDKLAWLFGVMQTLVSVVQLNDDSIKSIHAGDVVIVFFVRKPLTLVAVSRTRDSVAQLTSQLNYVFNQIASALTLTKLINIYEERQNFDLRRLLAGVDRLIDHLLDYMEREPAIILGAIQCLPLKSSVRDNITSAITGACSKIKNLMFAILLADNKLITFVRMKKYCLHPADLHLIFNLVQSSESLKTAENWTPLCLPRFEASGYLYGHVSYLSEDCQACLLLLTLQQEVFSTLSQAKQKIVEKLRRNNCMEAINESLRTPEETCSAAGFSQLRHYLYKSKNTAQFTQPTLAPPYTGRIIELMELYKRAHGSLHLPARPLEFSFEKTTKEAVLARDTSEYELYAIFEPFVDTNTAIACISKLINWINKRKDMVFHLNAPTF